MTPTVRLLRLLGPQAGRIAAAAAVAVLAEAAAVALLGTAAWLIARAAQRPELAALTLAIVVVRGLALSRGPLRYADRLLGHDAVLRATAELRGRVFAALRPLAPAGTTAFRSGDLLTRLVADTDAAQDLILRCLLPAGIAAVMGAAVVGLGLALLPAAGVAVALGLLLCGVLVPWCVLRAETRRERRGTDTALLGAVTARAVELARGAEDLAVFGAGHQLQREAAHDLARLAARQRRRAGCLGLAQAAQLAMLGGTVLAVALLAAWAHATAELSAVHVVVLPALTLALVESVAALPEAAGRYAAVRCRAWRLTELWDAAAPVTEPAAGGASLPAVPRIEIRGLVARYPGAAQPALRGVDLTLAPGERVAISGASGSGKSTLAAVLMRFLDPEQGQVLLAGREIRTVRGAEVRAVLTGATQDAHVFRASVRDNLRLAAPEADDPALRAMLGRVRLGGWLAELPAGLDTVLTGDGEALSGGQRSRLLLARALLADPGVLILDEPTNGLDAETARAVLADLLTAAGDRSVLLITHDPVPPSLVGRTVYLEAGRNRGGTTAGYRQA